MTKKSGEENLKKIKVFFNSIKWILFVSKRFNLVDRTGRSRINSFLASLGICFGVMTLITVISVMNGFQMSFKDSIMEISSYHIRVSGLNSASINSFLAYCNSIPEIKTSYPFLEAQSLMVGKNGQQSPALIRAVPSGIFDIDSGFKKEAKIWAGTFDLNDENSIILGTELSRRVSSRLGGSVNLFALSGGNDVSLLSNDRVFNVNGLFRCGYADINASYAFIRLEDGVKYFGKDAALMAAIKLYKTDDDSKVISQLKTTFPELNIESWKSYNRSFFGTLKIEKNLLFLLVLIIFIVVAINIFNGMRRMVFERKEEISILSAFGSKKENIQLIFILQGLLIGLKGAIPGLLTGLLLSINMSRIFIIMSKIVYYVQYFVLSLLSPSGVVYLNENSMYLVYANIPPRIFVNEVFFITIFGIFSSLFASWIASKNVLKLTVAEVMRDE